MELSGIPDEPDSHTQEFADGFAAATADFESMDLVDLEGEAAPGLDPKPAPAPRPQALAPQPAPAPAQANLELAVDRDVQTGAAKAPTAPTPAPAAPAPEAAPAGLAGDLQLDFEKAGISSPVKGQAAPGEVRAPAPVVEPNAIGVGMEPSAASASGMQASPAPRGAKTGLFGSDRIMGFLIAAAIGLLLGIFPALQASKSLLRDSTEATIAEMEESVERPLAVRAGKLRSVAHIRSDLDLAYEAARSRFWTVWLGVALPLALGLGLIRRRA
jgi:hypothetical protein